MRGRPRSLQPAWPVLCSTHAAEPHGGNDSAHQDLRVHGLQVGRAAGGRLVPLLLRLLLLLLLLLGGRLHSQ